MRFGWITRSLWHTVIWQDEAPEEGETDHREPRQKKACFLDTKKKNLKESFIETRYLNWALKGGWVSNKRDFSEQRKKPIKLDIPIIPNPREAEVVRGIMSSAHVTRTCDSITQMNQGTKASVCKTWIWHFVPKLQVSFNCQISWAWTRSSNPQHPCLALSFTALLHLYHL